MNAFIAIFLFFELTFILNVFLCNELRFTRLKGVSSEWSMILNGNSEYEICTDLLDSQKIET